MAAEGAAAPSTHPPDAPVTEHAEEALPDAAYSDEGSVSSAEDSGTSDGDVSELEGLGDLMQLMAAGEPPEAPGPEEEEEARAAAQPVSPEIAEQMPAPPQAEAAPVVEVEAVPAVADVEPPAEAAPPVPVVAAKAVPAPPVRARLPPVPALGPRRHAECTADVEGGEVVLLCKGLLYSSV